MLVQLIVNNLSVNEVDYAMLVSMDGGEINVNVMGFV
jgi:hypothetical protein